MKTIVAAALALLEVTVDKEHYADFFAWRAEHLPGHLALYARAAELLNRKAAERGESSFSSASPANRSAIAREVLLLGETSEMPELLRAVGSRQKYMFDRYIAVATFRLFRRTDLYVHLGYPTWPGVPEGFESHLRFLEEKGRSVLP